MEICRRNNEIEISELDPFLAELLRQIPASTDPEGISAAERRLFSPPADPSETEICAEWKLYVKPELRRLFQTATETVAADLEQRCLLADFSVLRHVAPGLPHEPHGRCVDALAVARA